MVLENYGPGTMERLGCGYEQLAPINPRLVYLALKGFLAGPYEHRPALDEVVQFQVGLAYMTGPPGRPLRAGASIIDILGAVFGVVAALGGAARARRDGPRPARLQRAVRERGVPDGQPHGRPRRDRRAAAADAGAARRLGDLQVFETADGEQLFIGVTSDQQWTRFCEAFGLPELPPTRAWRPM